MQTLGSPASVVAAIREDAAAEAERIRESAAAETKALRENAAALDVSIRDREERLAAARRAIEDRIAKQEWEGRRAAIEQREEWIRRVIDAAKLRFVLTDALIGEARSHLPAVPYTVDGGVVAAGDLSFDNSFDARVSRLEPEWRSALSGIYVP